ncbi:MAG: cyclodeaminase/cyclohydrolase family protein [Pseudomonadota bacterium]
MSFREMSLGNFVRDLSGGEPAPGGGCAAALAGGLAAALVAMVARLTVGRRKYAEVGPEMELARDKADRLAERLLNLVDLDAASYGRVMAAHGLPRDDEVQRERRRQAVDEALKGAAAPPLETLRAAFEALELVDIVLERGNANCLTDAAAAMQLIRAAALGASYNVRINLLGTSDGRFKDAILAETASLVDRVKAEVDRMGARVERVLG